MQAFHLQNVQCEREDDEREVVVSPQLSVPRGVHLLNRMLVPIVEADCDQGAET